MKLNKAITLFAAAGVAIAAIAQNNNVIEEVAWWIGDQPIYKSEVEEMYQTMLYERANVDGDPYCVIPEQLAIEKLFLHQAELDTVEVSEGAVSQRVEMQINYLINELGTQEKVEQFYRRPLPQIRETMMESMRNRYKVQEVQANLTKDVKTTPSDVRKYFSGLPQDSIPFVPMQVEVQILTINPVIPREEIEEVKSRLRDYADKVNKGEADFSTLAILHSEAQDGSGMRGGETGFLGRGHLEPEYAAAAFNLNDTKKVSKIVETTYGYHIIQLIEKRGDRINTRHILLRPKVAEKDLTDAINRLDSVRSDILAEKFTFEDAVVGLSQDKNTRFNRGLMVNGETGTTRFQMGELPQEVSRAVNTMSIGEVSKPFIMSDPTNNREIVSIVKLADRIDGHRATLSDDYQMIKDMYENSLRNKIIAEWIDKKIKDTYVRIEDGWRDCDFQHDGWLKRNKNQ